MANPASRPFITCHVLDTITGTPGANIGVKLSLLSPPASTFSTTSTTTLWEARTNADGRVTSWSPEPHYSDSSSDLNAVVETARKSFQDAAGAEMVFKLTFDTEGYFGKGKTFWPEVELTFAARVGEAHYHVPLLLGPWSFTTYRGS